MRVLESKSGQSIHVPSFLRWISPAYKPSIDSDEINNLTSVSPKVSELLQEELAKLQFIVQSRSYLQGICDMLVADSATPCAAMYRNLNDPNEEVKSQETAVQDYNRLLTKQHMDYLYSQVDTMNCAYIVMNFSNKHNLFHFIQQRFLSEYCTVYYVN